MKTVFVSVFAFCLAVFPGVVSANDLTDLDGLSQEEFRAVSRDLTGMTVYRSLTSSTPGGWAGFELGVDASLTGIEDRDAWESATGERPSSLLGARIRASKGLPFGFDVGGSYTEMPGTNISVMGLEGRYALVEGGLAVPAVGLRAGFSEIEGIRDFEFRTINLDMAISKGFGPLTPYAGIGRVWTRSAYTGEEPALGSAPDRERFGQSRIFAGLRLSAVVMNVVLEYDRTGDNESYSAKFAIGF